MEEKNSNQNNVGANKIMRCICGTNLFVRRGGKTECPNKPHKRCLKCGSFVPKNNPETHQAEVYSIFKWFHPDYKQRDGKRELCTGKIVSEKEFYRYYMNKCDRFKLTKLQHQNGRAVMCQYCGYYTVNTDEKENRGHELQHAKMFYYLLQIQYFNEARDGQYERLVTNLYYKLNGITQKCKNCKIANLRFSLFCCRCGYDFRKPQLIANIFQYAKLIDSLHILSNFNFERNQEQLDYYRKKHDVMISLVSTKNY